MIWTEPSWPYVFVEHISWPGQAACPRAGKRSQCGRVNARIRNLGPGVVGSPESVLDRELDGVAGYRRPADMPIPEMGGVRRQSATKDCPQRHYPGRSAEDLCCK